MTPQLPMTAEQARLVVRDEIVPGNRYPFYAELQEDYHPGNRMRNYTGQQVTVLRVNEDSDWFEPYTDDSGELIEPEVSKTFIVRADDGFEFTAMEEELNGWDHDLGQFFWPDGTHGHDHDTRFLANERPA